MKAKATVSEFFSVARRLSQRIQYGSVKLMPDALINSPELHFRKDDRAPLEIVIADGFTGRDYSGCPVEMSMYIQTNTPKVGYSGCKTLDDSLAWSLEVAESLGRKKANPPPQNIYVSIVDPKFCQLVWVPTLVQLNNVGFTTDSSGLRVRILDDNGKVIGFENKYVPEKELLVLGSIPVMNIMACIDKEDQERLRDGQPVLNRMHEHNSKLVEKVRANDFRSYSSLMLAFLQDGKTEAAKVIAEKVSAERVRTEAQNYGIAPKQTEMMLSFLKSAQSPEQTMEAYSVSMKSKI